MSAPAVQQAAPVGDRSQSHSLDEEKNGKTTAEVHADNSGNESEDDGVEPQNGVKKIQAITSAWTYQALVLTYVL